jgi:hypothetical protein
MEMVKEELKAAKAEGRLTRDQEQAAKAARAQLEAAGAELQAQPAGSSAARAGWR